MNATIGTISVTRSSVLVVSQSARMTPANITNHRAQMITICPKKMSSADSCSGVRVVCIVLLLSYESRLVCIIAARQLLRVCQFQPSGRHDLWWRYRGVHAQYAKRHCHTLQPPQG